MKVRVTQPVLSAINTQTPGTAIEVGMTGTGAVGRGFRLPDHLADHPSIKMASLDGRPISVANIDQMSPELKEIVASIMDLCGVPSMTDFSGPSARLADTLGKGLATIDLVEVGIDAGDLISMMLPGVRPLSVTINLCKIGRGLFGIWSKMNKEPG